MWIRDHSVLLLVRVRHERWRLWLPIPLFVLTGFFDALEDLSVLGDWIFSANRRRSSLDSFGSFSKKYETFRTAVTFLRQFLGELGRYGRWRMIEIEIPGETQVFVDLF